MTVDTPDIATPSDVARLVDAFYERVREDDVLGPIFDDVARVDWEAHLPRMYAFWGSILLGTAGFTGNPMAVHRALARRTSLTPREFDRWLLLFGQTADALFAGPCAEDAKLRARRIARTMQHHIDMDRGHAPVA